ncbi:uncharacterized protein METZ01_LOCUS124225, partial [marine metagenome]
VGTGILFVVNTVLSNRIPPVFPVFHVFFQAAKIGDTTAPDD